MDDVCHVFFDLHESMNLNRSCQSSAFFPNRFDLLHLELDHSADWISAGTVTGSTLDLPKYMHINTLSMRVVHSEHRRSFS